MRLVFAGSPAAAVPSLTALADGPHEVVAVLTRDDTPQGRRRVLTPTPVAVEADRLGLRVVKARRITPEVTAELSALDPDLGVVVAYGALLREPLLGAPRLGWVNLHFSLLPSWRGAAPVQRSLMAGDVVTGAAVFQLVPELDAGDVFGQFTQPIGAHENAGHLLDSLAVSGAELLSRVVDAIADGDARAEPQAGDVTLAPKLTLPDGELDFARPAQDVVNLVRGVTPEPGAFTTLDGARLKVLDAAIARDSPRLAPGHLERQGKLILVGTATEPVQLVTVHPAGRKAMAAGDWWRGRPADAATTVDARSAE